MNFTNRPLISKVAPEELVWPRTRHRLTPLAPAPRHRLTPLVPAPKAIHL